MVYTGGKLAIIGGTSAAAPAFAGIATLLNQYLVMNGVQQTAGLGNINPKLYSLAQTTTGVFHDITTGSNSVTVSCSTRAVNCTPSSYGFDAAPGYDQATGLGSVDAHKRASRRSPTRSALAMIVRAGFTAPLDGKKLPSTT